MNTSSPDRPDPVSLRPSVNLEALLGDSEAQLVYEALHRLREQAPSIVVPATDTASPSPSQGSTSPPSRRSAPGSSPRAEMGATEGG